jgi:hypothetical protein
MAFSFSSLSKAIQSSKVVSQKRQHLRTIAPRAQHGVSEIWKWLNTSPRLFKRWAQQWAVEAWSGDPNESAKKIIRNPSARKVFSKTLVHIPPIVAAVVLLALNFTGYFIGNELTGWNFGSWQDFYKLCFQVAAKVHVRDHSRRFVKHYTDYWTYPGALYCSLVINHHHGYHPT